MTEEEFEASPAYLRTSLALPLERVNECMETVNDAITDKRFDVASGEDFVTAEELCTLLRLRDRTKTFILLLLHSGRLKGLDSRNAGAGSAGGSGGARYRIAK